MTISSNRQRSTEGRGRLYDSIIDTVGDTPCVRINHLAPEHVRIYAKAEFFNPAWLHRRPLLPLTGCGRWSDGLVGSPPDERRLAPILPWVTADEVVEGLQELGIGLPR